VTGGAGTAAAAQGQKIIEAIVTQLFHQTGTGISDNGLSVPSRPIDMNVGHM
jgi:hypothetical protein